MKMRILSKKLVLGLSMMTLFSVSAVADNTTKSSPILQDVTTAPTLEELAKQKADAESAVKSAQKVVNEEKRNVKAAKRNLEEKHDKLSAKKENRKIVKAQIKGQKNGSLVQDANTPSADELATQKASADDLVKTAQKDVNEEKRNVNAAERNLEAAQDKLKAAKEKLNTIKDQIKLQQKAMK